MQNEGTKNGANVNTLIATKSLYYNILSFFLKTFLWDEDDEYHYFLSSSSKSSCKNANCFISEVHQDKGCDCSTVTITLTWRSWWLYTKTYSFSICFSYLKIEKLFRIQLEFKIFTLKSKLFLYLDTYMV